MTLFPALLFREDVEGLRSLTELRLRAEPFESERVRSEVDFDKSVGFPGFLCGSGCA